LLEATPTKGEESGVPSRAAAEEAVSERKTMKAAVQEALADGPIHAVAWPIGPGGAAAGVDLPSGKASGDSVRRDSTFRRLLALADISAAGVTLLCVISFGRPDGVRPQALLGLGVAVVAAKVLGLYDRDELVFHKSTLDEAPALFQLATLYALLIWMLQSQVLQGPAGRGDVLLMWGVFFLADAVLRVGARRLARRVAPAERCLIVGQSSARIRLAAKLALVHSRTRIVGALPLNDERRLDLERRRQPRRGVDRRRHNLHIEDLDDIVRRLRVHRVIILPGSSDPEEMLDSIGRAKALGVKVSIVPRLFEVVGSSVEFDDLEGLTMLGLRRFGLSRSSKGLKRTMDIAGALVLGVVLAPLWALVALLIRLDSRGPVFYRQVRVGLDGRFFAMFKFRTMVDGAHAQREALRHLNESQGLFKMTHDPRVTRVGRVLRRAAIDELPQLINVLRGEMSLVGPRPLIVDEDRQVAGRHRGRLRLVPGITGPWQLLGPTRVPLNEMVTIDYLYGANWSLWNDIKIILRTVAYVIHRRGL
jgi:exopolysaccharide biosynthesis polyprenyl glycosylphosphotransferase